MAADRKPEPPRTLEEWRAWSRKAKRYWLPTLVRINWPENLQSGPGWAPFAYDHPFAGRTFCWRCIAEAEDFPDREGIPHWSKAICWGPTEGDQAPEHTEPDTFTPEECAAFDRGFGIEDAPPVADTGNLFWPPPGWSSRAECEYPEESPPVRDYRNTWPPTWTDEADQSIASGERVTQSLAPSVPAADDEDAAEPPSDAEA